MANKEILQYFLDQWNNTKQEIDYNEEWEMSIPPFPGVRYEAKDRVWLESALVHPDIQSLKFGEVVKTIDNHGQRILLVNTRIGAALVYEHKGNVIATCSDRLRFTQLIPFSFILCSKEDVARIVGGSFNSVGILGIATTAYLNIGYAVERLYRMLEDPSYVPKPWELP